MTNKEMTNEEAINVLTLHKEHWERLIREHITEKQEGEEMVEVLGKAIEALDTLDNNTSVLDEKASEKLMDIIEKEADNE